MNDMLYQLSDRDMWIVIAVFSALLVFISAVADRRRGRRTQIENVGFMPWTAITVFAVMCTLLATALAIKSL
jgi:hypothetical protein